MVIKTINLKDAKKVTVSVIGQKSGKEATSVYVKETDGHFRRVDNGYDLCTYVDTLEKFIENVTKYNPDIKVIIE